MKIDHITPLHYDDVTTIHFKKNELITFLNNAVEYQSKFKWHEMSDPTEKTFWFSMVELLRKMHTKPFDESEVYTFVVDYREAALIYRISKIMQINIGEENAEQKFFQEICQNLFKVL